MKSKIKITLNYLIRILPLWFLFSCSSPYHWVKTHNRFQNGVSKLELNSKSILNNYQNRSKMNFSEESQEMDSSSGVPYGFSIPSNKDHGLNKINLRKFSYLNIQSFNKALKKYTLSKKTQLTDLNRNNTLKEKSQLLMGYKKPMLDTTQKPEDRTTKITNLKNNPPKRHRSIAHWIFTIIGYTFVIFLAVFGLFILLYFSFGGSLGKPA